jgi:hypothetical protein
VFQNLFDIVDATLLLALFTFILALTTVNSTRKFQEEEKIKRELNWIEKQIENFYSPLIFCLDERIQLINKYEKTEKTEEKAELKNLIQKNIDNLNKIYIKYIYIGLSWENYDPDVDITDFFDKNLFDKNKIDTFRAILINKMHKLSEKHDILLEKVKIRGVSISELEKYFKKEN